jgi:hypothetical protein
VARHIEHGAAAVPGLDRRAATSAVAFKFTSSLSPNRAPASFDMSHFRASIRSFERWTASGSNTRSTSPSLPMRSM